MKEKRNFGLEADRFLVDHKGELDFLLLCPLCVAFHPKAGHKRKIFKAFLACETDVQTAILATINKTLLPKIEDNFLKNALDVYRKYQAELELGSAYPDSLNNYTPMFHRAFRLYRYMKIPMQIRKYTLSTPFATKPAQTIIDYLEDYVARLRTINKTNKAWFCPPFDLVNSEGNFFYKRENVYYSWGMYFVLLGTNMVLKTQGEQEVTTIDYFLKNDLIMSVEDLYYVTMYALMLMMDNEGRNK